MTLIESKRFQPSAIVKLEQVFSHLLGKTYLCSNDAFNVLKNVTHGILVSSENKDINFSSEFLTNGLRSIKLKVSVYKNTNKPDHEVESLIKKDSFLSTAHRKMKSLGIETNPFNDFKIHKDTFAEHEANDPGNVMKHVQGVCYAQAMHEVMRSLVENACVSDKRLNNIFNKCISSQLTLCLAETEYEERSAQKIDVFCPKTKATMRTHFDNALGNVLQNSRGH